MYRTPLFLIALAACVVWAGGSVFAQGNDNEFQLPPVKLKPDRPTKTKPIPPTPDDREPPEVAPGPKEVEPAPPAPKAPEKAPPVVPVKPEEAPKQVPPAPPIKPPAPPVEVPSKVKPPVEAPARTPEEAVKEADTALTAPALKTPPDTVKVEPPPDLAIPPAIIVAPEKADSTGSPDLAIPPPVIAVPEKEETPVPPAEVQAETVEAQVEPGPEMDLRNLGEVGLVEEVARLRKAYGRALAALKDHYTKRGTVHKIEWVNSELAAFEKVPKVQYLIVSELAGPGLKPTRRIEAADQLFTEGTDYKNYPSFPPAKKDYLKQAIQKFTTIIEKYPESDKIDDAAFGIGEIYSGWYFEDWARAVSSYERCWQWDPRTPYPAVFNAAKIYDEKLKNRVKAVELYNRVMAESKNEDLVRQAQERIRALTGR
ncbi:MAG: hypothetical protein IMZ66_11980 [Planctomycetes bacterium]|nr:hypothetical protein [Planctomycetota bacterium]